jgi:hypothetical protein
MILTACRLLKLVSVPLLLLGAGDAGSAGAPLPSAVAAAPAQPPPACTAPEFRQFDFWLGDWDATEAGSPGRVARTRVERILDGCVLRELYDGADGHRGESFSLYLASKGVWHQTWVTNRGQLLEIEGRMQDGQMALSGAERLADGGERQVRGVWKPVPGGVRETAVTSVDGGKTWQPWFDLLFVPHRP